MSSSESARSAATTTWNSNPWLYGIGWFGGSTFAVGVLLFYIGRDKHCYGSTCLSDWEELLPAQVLGLVLLAVGLLAFLAVMALAAVFWQLRHRPPRSLP
ncbi:hypothetical protein GCM10009682_41600 [Luedemannella flava]|uniref:Uncharacterized protein n=1 Tax=Luedemannella flava TaxID=349316 RepID=A0ABN2MA05_9ACTN